MLTKWGQKIVNANGFEKIYPKPEFNMSTNNIGCINAKSVAGDNFIAGPFSYSAASSYNALITSIVETGSTASVGVAFGSGDTPATDEDYTIGSIISTLSGSAASAVTSYDATLEKYKVYINYTLTNTGSESITIKEVCRFNYVFPATAIGQQASGFGSQKSVLIDRVVLDTPVTIAAGESGIVRYETMYN